MLTARVLAGAPTMPRPLELTTLPSASTILGYEAVSTVPGIALLTGVDMSSLSELFLFF